MSETSAGAATSGTPRRRALLAWGAFATLRLFQWALFRQDVEREIASGGSRGAG